MTDNEKNGTIDIDSMLSQIQNSASPGKKKVKKTKSKKKAAPSKADKNSATIEANKASEQRFNSGISPARVTRDESAKIGKKSWQPANELYLPEDKKEDEYEYRFLRADNNNIRKKVTQLGYEIDNSGILNSSRSLGMGSNMDGTTVVNDLILARRPKEIGEAREAAKREKLRIKQGDAVSQKAEIGGDAYGRYEVS